MNAAALGAFEGAGQVFAIWSDKRDSDAEAWRHLWDAYDGLRKATAGQTALRAYAAVEDARLLEGDLSRLRRLKDAGFSLIGLTWSGDGPICSAHDAALDGGLTPFGRSVVAECLTLGLIPDLSHASHKTADQVLTMAESAGKPVCFSHSAFASLCPHSRNLTDEEARRVAALGGVIGIPLVCAFLGGGDLSAVCAQLTRAYENGVGEATCLGCDFDGTTDLPGGLRGLRDLPRLAEALSDAGFSACAIERMTWGTAAAFFERWGAPTV